MPREELVWCTAYGAAFAAALVRCGHGKQRDDHTADPARSVIDASAEAKAWATVAAELAVRSLEEA